MAERTPPTPVAMLIGTAIIAGVSGYLIGIASSLGFLPIPFMPKAPRGRGVEFYDDEEESEAEDVDEGILDHAPNWANGLEADKRDGLRATAASRSVSTRAEEREKEVSTGDEECKMVLVVRTDLGMTKGKIAAQCSHATLDCYKTSLSTNRAAMLRRWERGGQAKVALQVKSLEELLSLQAAAMSLGLVARVITDAGRTQIESGSQTVLGIGPAPKSIVDKVSGHLKLL